MLILLPPSEGKAVGGHRSKPFSLESISHNAELGKTRREILDALVEISSDLAAGSKALKLGPTQFSALEKNVTLEGSPTLLAAERYTGVLFDALDLASLSPSEFSQAAERLRVSSALFGLLKLDDLIPEYRLSADSRIPALGPLTRIWKPVLTPLLETQSRSAATRSAAARSGTGRSGVIRSGEAQLVIDLRSGAYQKLAPLRDAVLVRVLSVQPDGSRKVVSHHNKSTKGLFARALALSTDTANSFDELLELASVFGFLVEQSAPNQLDIILRPK